MFNQIQASALCMGLLASAFVWSELLCIAAGHKASIAGAAAPFHFSTAPTTKLEHSSTMVCGREKETKEQSSGVRAGIPGHSNASLVTEGF
jgi:hypothetical protein